MQHELCRSISPALSGAEALPPRQDLGDFWERCEVVIKGLG